jgi:hypothetical protein
MATITNLSESKRKILERHVERIKSSTNLDTFKSMYAKMKLTFGEENIQIKRIDEEYCMETITAIGWTASVMHTARDDQFESALNSNCSKYELIIKFPQVTITNGRRKTVIHDLFVKMRAHPKGTLVSTLEGVVATYTKAHALGCYMHSHLAAQDVRRRTPVFGTFCLGEGEITQVLTLLAQRYNEINFAMLCIHIRNFVEWESLDGVPHVKLENIPNMNSTPAVAPNLSLPIANSKANALMVRFKALAISEARKKVVLSADDVSIIAEPTDELSVWAAGLMDSYPQLFGEDTYSILSYLAYKGPKGEYLAANTPSPAGDVRPATGTILRFRGEDIKTKIIDNDLNLKSTKYANPQIIEQFCSRLSEELTAAAIDYAEAGDNDTCNNNGQAASTNPDPVQQNTPA